MKSVFLYLAVLCLGLPGTAFAVNLSVTVKGVTGELRDNVLARLSLFRQQNNPDLTEAMIRDLYQKSEREIREALQPFGYYGPVIKSKLARKDGILDAAFSINPGKPVRISKVNVLITGPGSTDPVLEKFKKNFPLKEGEVLNDQKYERAKNQLHETATGRGYLDSRFSVHEIKVFPEEHLANIHLELETGPLFHFGEVTFNQETFSLKFLDRFLPFKEGDPYRVAGLFELQDSLINSDYFSMVEVQPQRGETKGLEVPVKVQLVPRKRQKYSIGFGYGTDTGFRGLVGWEARWVNRRGHRFATELRLSEIKDSFTARYTIPMRHPETDHLDLNAGWLKEDTTTSRSNRLVLGTSFNHKRGPWWQETYYLNFQNEDYTVAGESGYSRLLLPGASWQRLRADNRVNPSRGSDVLFEIKGTHEAIGSNVAFIQGRVRGKVVRTYWPSGRFIVRADLGATWVDSFNNLPASLRFFAGGDQSVRGYAYNSLGPVNDQGEVTGGRYLVTGSIEYDQHVYGKWSAAVFYDAGNALNSLPGSLKQGAGVGVRWSSPVGPVRLDVADALSKPGTVIRVHFNIGPEL